MIEAYSHLKLKIVDGSYQYVRFPTSEALWECASQLRKTEAKVFLLFDEPDDHSLIVDGNLKPFGDVAVNAGWKAIRVAGEIPFGTAQGLLSTISTTLKQNRLGVCVVSTYLTDFFFIVEKEFDRAVEALKHEGWTFV